MKTTSIRISQRKAYYNINNTFRYASLNHNSHGLPGARSIVNSIRSRIISHYKTPDTILFASDL